MRWIFAPSRRRRALGGAVGGERCFAGATSGALIRAPSIPVDSCGLRGAGEAQARNEFPPASAVPSSAREPRLFAEDLLGAGHGRIVVLDLLTPGRIPKVRAWANTDAATAPADGAVMMSGMIRSVPTRYWRAPTSNEPLVPPPASTKAVGPSRSEGSSSDHPPRLPLPPPAAAVTISIGLPTGTPVPHHSDPGIRPVDRHRNPLGLGPGDDVGHQVGDRATGAHAERLPVDPTVSRPGGARPGQQVDHRPPCGASSIPLR